MLLNKSFIRHLLCLLCGLIISGCASTPYIEPTPIQQTKEAPSGIYHRVEKKQTLWRISKMYNVDLDDLAKVNNISDTTNIEIGQLILIPKQKTAIVAPPVNSTKDISISKYSGDSSADDFIWPLKGRVISAFGQSYNNMVNKGINIKPEESTDVFAAREGKVAFYSDNFIGFGKTIIIEHGDGFSTVYARNSEVFVKPGDQVEKGTLIAKAGSSDRDKEVYLHFEIRKGHVPQNPNFYLSR